METDLEEITVTAKPLPTNKHVDTRDFRIDSISLISADGRVREIVGMVMELQLRQDMYLGFMSGELLISDAIGLFSEVQFHGNEFVYFDIKEPAQDIAIRKAFRVYKISNRDRQQNNASRYVMYLVSDEFVVSSSTRISKAYKNMTISEIATDIMKNYLHIPEKKIFVDPTTQPYTIVIPNMRPLEALNWLAVRANTPNDTCYFFYENLEGFHFRSLQSLYKDPVAIPQPYMDQNKSVEKTLASDKYSIDSWSGVKEFDLLSSLSGGMYSIGLLELDPIAQGFVSNKYNLKDNKGLYPNPPSSNDATTMGDDVTAKFHTYLSAGDTRNWIQRLMGFAAVNNNLTEIVVPGSVRVQAGKTLELVFPYLITPNDTADNVDKIRSGRYLVVAVNQKIDMLNERYQTVALVARDSVPEAYPSTDPAMASKIRKLNT